MNTAVVSVGSNINPRKNIKLAQEIIAGEFTLLNVSSFKQTEPIGFKEQDDFYNGAFLVKTELEIENFNSALKKIEVDMGRIKTSNKQGPRIIDLDIVIWNNKIMDDDVYQRGFLKNSILELIPEFNF